MKLRFATIAIAVLATVIALADLKSELQQRYDAMGVAAKRKSVAGIMAFMTPDYVDTDHEGKKRNRKEFEKYMQAQFGTPGKVKSVTITIQKAIMKGGFAAAEVSSVIALEVTNPQTKKLVNIVATNSFSDVWVMSKQKLWMCKSSTTTKSKMTVDGKPVGGGS